MNLRQYIPDHAVTTIPALALLLLLLFLLSGNDPQDRGIELTSAQIVEYDRLSRLGWRTNIDIDGEVERLNIDDAVQAQEMRTLLGNGEYKQARIELLKLASAAVQKDDKSQLGDTMLLLGEVAIEQQELGAAEIYLQESLYLMMSLGNSLGTARCYQQLGKLNIKARALARQASNTYDKLWQARNATSRGYYQGVSESLHLVVEENLEIHRYGAAADAWEALAELHDKLHDDYLAQQARIEAALLYASTGRLVRSRKLIAGLDRQQVGEGELIQLKQQIDDLFEQHQQDQIQTSRAHDYQMLYHHYQRSGDIERAWSFRIKASQSLARTTDRSVFQRQADIIAVLYNSNFAMERARRYLDQAVTLYGDGEVQELLEQTLEMEAQIF